MRVFRFPEPRNRGFRSPCMWSCVVEWVVDCVWNVMAHAQKPDFVSRRNGRVHFNGRGGQFSRLLAGELCASACRVCTARTSLCSAVMWRLPVTHSILLFPLHFSSRASPCAITFQTQSTQSFDEKLLGHIEGLKFYGLWMQHFLSETSETNYVATHHQMP